MPDHDMQETEDWLERLTLAADSLPPGEERDGFMRELLQIRESLAALTLGAQLSYEKE